ncbi:hypothetical protein I3760_15G090900 [Carya illinoinensis]|nr:hypothetical protein I3760_15G090900 [Carya illinoinensis]
MKLRLLFLAFFLSEIYFVYSFTDPNDTAILNALKYAWKNTPPSWEHSEEPCSWDGVTCNNSRVIALKLSTTGLEGNLEGDIGGLTELTSLDLSFNRGLTGSLSPWLGDLHKLNFLSPLLVRSFNAFKTTTCMNHNASNLDLAENMLTGSLPISTSIAPGLDRLLEARHFHFNKNKLLGPILAKLFSSNMKLRHIIPPTLGLVKSLEVFRLDRNAITPYLSNLTNIIELNLALNKLTGTLPDLTQMTKLNHLDLSNNSFKPSEAPTWFSTLPTLTTLVMEYGSLQGPIPRDLFSFPQLQQVKLGNNKFSETLDMGVPEKISPQLKLADLQNNNISFVKLGNKYHKSLIELSNETVFKLLENNLSVSLSLLPGLVYIQAIGFNFDDYLQVQLALFPSIEKYFNRSEIQRIGFSMTTQEHRLPEQFGAYFFIADSYPFPGSNHIFTLCVTRVIIGITITCCAILVLGLLGVGIYAVQQKKRAEGAIGFSTPIQIQDYCTNNLAERNEIGSGAYGKVYRGLLSDGLVVAIKRAQQGSTQGLLEFKTEIELLSRVHHKNLVGLVGFCFEQGEQILIYKFMPNGTIRDSLLGKSSIYLDWNKRLYVALDSATGLAYLHEHANPSIIHRDVKSMNILLDEDLIAKVADFGLSKLVSDALNGHVSTQVKGTMGYLDPEYYQTQQLTEKRDVYSFGRPFEKGKYIVHRVRTAMNKDEEEHYGLWEMIDSSIRETTNLIGFGKFLEITIQCIEDSPENRPTMSEVVKALETILQNDGVASSTSMLSSKSDLGASRGASKHPYNDP